MNTTNVVKTIEKTIEKPGNAPEKRFRAGAISATVWLNKGKGESSEKIEYRTVSIDRRYADKNGNWQSTNTLRVNDLPKLQAVLQKAFEYLVLNEQDLFTGA